MTVLTPLINVLIYWIYIIVIALIAFVPGFAIAVSLKNISDIKKLAVSFGFSFSIILLLIPLFAFKLDLAARVIFFIIFASSILYLKNQNIKFDPESKFLILILVISFISKFFIQTLWQYPVMGGDWYGHTLVIPYRFETGDWALPRDRTPVYNLLIYAYHHLLKTSLYQYWISQIINVIANSIFIVPAYLIAKKVFGGNIAKISIVFMLITPFLVENAVYTWPKNMAAYFILLMAYFLFFSESENKKLDYILAGVFGALGFLTHNYSAFYIITCIIALIYVKKAHKQNPAISLQRFIKSKYAYYLIAMIVVVTPYLLWTYSFYGTIFPSKFIYYPLAVQGYDAAFKDTAQELFKVFCNTPIKRLIDIRISNAVLTLTPAALPISPIAAYFYGYNPVFYYSHNYAGALSTLMYLLVVIWFFNYLFKKTKTNNILVMFVILPFIITLFIAGWRDMCGLGTVASQPAIPILIMFGFNELYRLNNRKIRSVLLYLVFIGCLIEDVIFSVLINKFYQLGGGLEDVKNGITSHIPAFQISNFISAHFLLGTNAGFLFNLIISAGIILISIYTYLRFSGRHQERKIL